MDMAYTNLYQIITSHILTHNNEHNDCPATGVNEPTIQLGPFILITLFGHG